MMSLVAVIKRFDERPYQCRTCKRSYHVQYHVCPRCEGFSVETVQDIQGYPG